MDEKGRDPLQQGEGCPLNPHPLLTATCQMSTLQLTVTVGYAMLVLVCASTASSVSVHRSLLFLRVKCLHT